MDFYRDLPSIPSIVGNNTHTQLAQWVQDLLITNYHSSDRDFKIKGLPSMLMERDLLIRQLQEELKMKSTQEIVEDVTNIIDFKEVQAKMAGKLPPDGNWIKDFKAGTRFLAYMKANTASILWDFILGTDPKELPAIYLGYENGPQGFGWRWHNPVKFCKEFGLYSILEVSDGNTNKVSEGTMEGDGKSQIVPPVHETE